MKIENVVVSNLEESIMASGFPMQTVFSPEDFEKNKDILKKYIFNMLNDKKEFSLSENEIIWCEKQLKRAKALAGCSSGESHDCYLCGIVVSFNVTAPRYWYPEMQRYHFADIVSSTSTMHKLKSVCNKILAGEMDWRNCFAEGKFNEGLVKCALGAMNVVMNDETLDENEKVRQIKGLLPESYLQTCRIVTNYRQLKTWRLQRKNHRLQEWRDVCKWIDTLPLFTFLVGESK